MSCVHTCRPDRRRAVRWVVALAVVASVQWTDLVAQTSESEGEQAIIAELLEGLASVDGLTAHFREVRESPLLEEPIIVEGQIWIASKTLLRTTSTPIESTLLIESNRVVLVDENGRQELSLRSRAPAATIGRLFYDLIAGDVEPLLRRYEARTSAASQPGDDWIIDLSAKRRRARGIPKMKIVGNANVLRRVSLWDADGHETAITFHDVEIRPISAASLLDRVP